MIKQFTFKSMIQQQQHIVVVVIMKATRCFLQKTNKIDKKSCGKSEKKSISAEKRCRKKCASNRELDNGIKKL